VLTLIPEPPEIVKQLADPVPKNMDEFIGMVVGVTIIIVIQWAWRRRHDRDDHVE